MARPRRQLVTGYATFGGIGLLSLITAAVYAHAEEWIAVAMCVGVVAAASVAGNKWLREDPGLAPLATGLTVVTVFVVFAGILGAAAPALMPWEHPGLSPMGRALHWAALAGLVAGAVIVGLARAWLIREEAWPRTETERPEMGSQHAKAFHVLFIFGAAALGQLAWFAMDQSWPLAVVIALLGVISAGCSAAWARQWPPVQRLVGPLMTLYAVVAFWGLVVRLQADDPLGVAVAFQIAVLGGLAVFTLLVGAIRLQYDLPTWKPE